MVSRETGKSYGLYEREVGFYREIAHTVAIRTPMEIGARSSTGR